MTKTLDDYMNDPDLANELEPLREIHAIRLMLRDETKGMTAAERVAHVNRNAEAFLATIGEKLRYDLAGKDGSIIDENL